MKKEKIMMEYLIINGYSLLNQNENNYCIDLKHIENIIEIARSNGIIILGGDLYSLDGNIFLNTLDNWYYEPESFSQEDSLKSIEKLYKFIENFKDKDNCYISFVFWPALYFNF